MGHLVRFRVAPLKTVQIDWPHVFAFLLTVAGLAVTFLQKQLSTGSPITWAAAAAALGGPVWMAFLENIVRTNIPTSFPGLADVPAPPAPPPMHERSISLRWARPMLFVLAVGSFAPEAGCSPAAQAIEARIEQVVLDDILNGRIDQIETDVAAIVLPGQPGADVVAIINAAVTLLIDLGKIPAQHEAEAKSVRDKTRAQMAAKGEI